MTAKQAYEQGYQDALTRVGLKAVIGKANNLELASLMEQGIKQAKLNLIAPMKATRRIRQYISMQQPKPSASTGDSTPASSAPQAVAS